MTQGVQVAARDIDVDLGGGRRLRGTVTDLYGDRVVKVSFSKLGPRHLLEAWVPLLALCADAPGRPWSAGAIGRGDFGRATDRSAFASVDGAGDLLRDLVAIYDAGMREPLPLPLKTGHAWATRQPAQRPPQGGGHLVAGAVRQRERGRGARAGVGTGRPARTPARAATARPVRRSPTRTPVSVRWPAACGSRSSSGGADDGDMTAIRQGHGALRPAR